MAAMSTARIASTVPSPAPAADRAGSGGRPAPDAPATVLSVRAWVTWVTVRCGNLDSTRAARPATMPLAVLVELIVP